jgi:uncharacterized membrane protein YbhN (UPF0104 family)
MVIQKPKIRKLKNTVIRLAVVAIAWYALWFQLRHHETLEGLLKNFADQFERSAAWPLLAGVVLLMVVNWSLEAIKWRYLIRKSEKISFFRSLKAIFTGISVGTFTPNRLGEFLGRSFVLDKTHPWKVFFITLIGSYSQLLSTIIFGNAALLFFLWHYAGLTTGFTYLDILIVFFAGMTVVILVAFYFNIYLIDRHFGGWVRKRKPGFAAWLHVLSLYTGGDLMVVLLFSLSRYIVFSIQFYLLLHLFGLSIPFWNAMVFTGVVYLVMTVIPSFALSEIGIRGSVAIYFFSFYFLTTPSGGDHTLGVVSASSLLWLINVMLPAALGTLFVYHLRVFRSNNGSG